MTASAVWGVAHAPGYPLLTALGHGFASIPLGSVPWRVHLTSALLHAATVGLVAWTTFGLTHSRGAALAAAWGLGFSRAFLLGSLYAEVFPLNDFFFACLLCLAIGERVSRGEIRALVAFAGLAGLGLAHHPMITLAAPALAVLLARPLGQAIAADARLAPLLLGALFAPFAASYALVPLAAAREPYLSWGDVHDLRSLLALVLRGDYGGPFSPAHRASLEPWSTRLVAFAKLVADSLGAPMLVLAAVGVAAQLRRRPAVGASLLLAFALSGPVFACANAIGVTSEVKLAYFGRFTTMCHVPLAIAFGAGAAASLRWLDRNRIARVAGAAALGTWLIARVLSAREVDLHADRRSIAFAHDLILPTPPRSLVLLSGDEPANAALYVCAVERTCGDRVVLSPGTLFLPWRLAQFRRRHPDVEIAWSGGPALARTHEIVSVEAARRPVFVYPDLLSKDPTLTKFAHSPDRLLFRMWPAGADPAIQRAAFLASAEALARGDCEGCSPWPVIEPPPSPELQLALAYQAAFVNHARAARAIDAGLERALEERARATLARLAGRAGADDSGPWTP